MRRKGQPPDEQAESKTRYALGVLRCRYEYWWSGCTPSEKLALRHVVTDRFFACRQFQVVSLALEGSAQTDSRNQNLQ